MSNVYDFQRRRLPKSPILCLETLLVHAKAGQLTGIAFVGLLPGKRYIADACGDAAQDVEETRRLLLAFEAKLARRRNGS